MADEVPRVVIRLATPRDADALLQLASRMADFELPPWRTPAEVTGADGRAMVNALTAGDPAAEVFVAESDRGVDGCLHMVVATDFFGRPHAHVSVIATSEAAEGTGVGRALMSHAEAWARGRGLALLTLNVFAGNARARRFYERGGFIPEAVMYARAID